MIPIHYFKLAWDALEVLFTEDDNDPDPPLCHWISPLPTTVSFTPTGCFKLHRNDKGCGEVLLLKMTSDPRVCVIGALRADNSPTSPLRGTDGFLLQIAATNYFTLWITVVAAFPENSSQILAKMMKMRRDASEVLHIVNHIALLQSCPAFHKNTSQFKSKWKEKCADFMSKNIFQEYM